jgi:hypothetical protein
VIGQLDLANVDFREQPIQRARRGERRAAASFL